LSSQQVSDRSPAAYKQGIRQPSNPLKRMIRSVVYAIPGGKTYVDPWLRKIRLQLRRQLWAMGADSQATDLAGNTLLVNPADITLCPKTEFAYTEFHGKTVNGDWDQSDKRFDSLSVYKAFDEVCRQKTKTWQETDYYKTMLASIEGGREYHRCTNAEEFDQRCAELTAIYESIAASGYKSQEELGGNPETEVAVAIGSAGQILFADGAHRLAMAKLLGISEIPVVVSVRHPKWAAFKAQLVEFTKTQRYGKLYQQACHPDTLSIPAEHGCADRFAVIEENMPVTSGELLDIGANLAYMCHRFEDIGFDCTAIEIDETHLYIMETLRAAADKNFAVVSGSFLEDMSLTDKEYEVVLALNIFHHFLKREPDYLKLIDFLDRLKTRYIVFEPHLTDEEQMVDVHKNYPADEFCAFVMEHTGMTNKQRIFEAHDGREVYLLSR
jgi:hypothetical protein